MIDTRSRAASSRVVSTADMAHLLAGKTERARPPSRGSGPLVMHFSIDVQPARAGRPARSRQRARGCAVREEYASVLSSARGCASCAPWERSHPHETCVDGVSQVCARHDHERHPEFTSVRVLCLRGLRESCRDSSLRLMCGLLIIGCRLDSYAAHKTIQQRLTKWGALASAPFLFSRVPTC